MYFKYYLVPSDYKNMNLIPFESALQDDSIDTKYILLWLLDAEITCVKVTYTKILYGYITVI